VANLPPASTAQGELVAKFAAGVIDTGGKFGAGVVDTGGNLPPVSLTPVANLPPVSLTPAVHLDLRVSPRIFEKIRNGPNGILWGWGELIHKKTRSKKSRDTVPLKEQFH
jgi:hypothetical protein